MIYFNVFGVLILTFVFVFYIIENYNRSLDRKGRVNLIIRRLIQLIVLGVVLWIVGHELQKIIKLENLSKNNILFGVTIYVSLSSCLYSGLLYIFDKLIRLGKFILRKTVGDTKTKVFSSRELPQKILVHTEENSSECSIETSKIPENIELVIWGEIITTNDSRESIQTVYACKNKSDEERLIEIVYKSLKSQAESMLDDICNEN